MRGLTTLMLFNYAEVGSEAQSWSQMESFAEEDRQPPFGGVCLKVDWGYRYCCLLVGLAMIRLGWKIWSSETQP